MINGSVDENATPRGKWQLRFLPPTHPLTPGPLKPCTTPIPCLHHRKYMRTPTPASHEASGRNTTLCLARISLYRIHPPHKPVVGGLQHPHWGSPAQPQPPSQRSHIGDRRNACVATGGGCRGGYVHDNAIGAMPHRLDDPVPRRHLELGARHRHGLHARSHLYWCGDNVGDSSGGWCGHGSSCTQAAQGERGQGCGNGVGEKLLGKNRKWASPHPRQTIAAACQTERPSGITASVPCGDG